VITSYHNSDYDFDLFNGQSQGFFYGRSQGVKEAVGADLGCTGKQLGHLLFLDFLNLLFFCIAKTIKGRHWDFVAFTCI